MTWTAVGSFGTDQNKTAGSTMSLFQPPSDIAAGSVLIVTIGCDNVQTTDGASSTVTSVVGSFSGTFTKAIEWTNSQGAAADGACVSVWYKYVNTLIGSGNDEIVITCNASVAAKAAGCYIFTCTGGQVNVAASSGAVSDTDPPSMTISGLSSREYLFIRADATERGNYGYGADATYTSFNANTTTSPGNQTDISIGSEYRIYTGTGDTTDPTTGTPQSASVYIAFVDAALATNVPVTGVSGTGSVGTVTVSLPRSVAVTGLAGTGAVGSTTQSGKGNVTLSNLLANTAIGSTTIKVNNSATLTGVVGTSALGTVTAAFTLNVPVTGVAGTGAVGDVTITNSGSVVVTGVAATGQIGTAVGSSPNSAILTGFELASALGTVTVSAKANVPVTGLSSTITLGTATAIIGTVVAVTSPGDMTGSIGTVGAGQTNTRVNLADLLLPSVSMSLGTIGIRAWGLVDDTAPSTWNEIVTE